MTLAEIALKRPITTVMLFISCVVFGLLSARLLKLEFFPELDAPFILVQVPYPGATPKEVEREIVRPLEESLATVSGIDNMSANADENGATFFLVFDWDRNINDSGWHWPLERGDGRQPGVVFRKRHGLAGLRHLSPQRFEAPRGIHHPRPV